MQAMLEIENDERRSVTELLQHGGNHHGTIADGVASDYQECELPCQPQSDETVIESGMRDGGRVVAANHVEHEIEGREDDNAPDESDPENDLGESHCCLGYRNLPPSRKGREKWDTRRVSRQKCKRRAALADSRGRPSSHESLLIRRQRLSRRCESWVRRRSRGTLDR